MPEITYEGAARLTHTVLEAACSGLEEITFQGRDVDSRNVILAALSEITLPKELKMPRVNIILGEDNRLSASNVLQRDGTITKEGNIFVVRAMGSSLAYIDGVICENSEAPVEERVYRKEFYNKKIYLPDEYDLASQNILIGENTVVLGMTGYSRIGTEKCEQWGITEEVYIAACENFLGLTVHDLKREFPNINVKIVEGASDLGVDRAAISVADSLNLTHLGFSCPKFMFYVKDNEDPVYVAESQKAYADAFIRSLNILYSVGGRMQALHHDMMAAVYYNKNLVLLDILGSICRNGAPQARDSSGRIENATAAFINSVRLLSSNIRGPGSYTDHVREASNVTIDTARMVIGPAAYSAWTHPRR